MNSPRKNYQPVGMTRRGFLGLTGAVLLTVPKLLAAGEPGYSIELGVCQSASKDALIKRSGFQYIEEGVSHALMPTAAEADFEKRVAELKTASLPIYACNGFIPKEMKMVGPSVDMDALLRYVTTVFRRAEIVGVKRIVFGSGSARYIPDGFDRVRARDQFIEFGRRIGPLAHDHGVIVVLEALNRGETNFINRVDEGLGLVEAIGHPGFQMHADFYHMLRENEGAESILKAGSRLRHCHIAEKKNRTAPGVAGDDFRPHLKALKAIGYQGGISIECSWKNLELELPKAAEVLREQLASA